jgi:hypothetical protein
MSYSCSMLSMHSKYLHTIIMITKKVQTHLLWRKFSTRGGSGLSPSPKVEPEPEGRARARARAFYLIRPQAWVQRAWKLGKARRAQKLSLSGPKGLKNFFSWLM